jgi:bifunctional UDP-N-acetylglucosamine pyrophosphorylase/glucosamine-1-phosphate N-acetyltransferase
MSFSVVILAAGKGTRMKSEKPKVLHTVGNASMLHHVMEVAKKAGAEETVIVAGHQAELISEVAKIKFPDAQIVIQEKQLGTGHAVKQAEKLLRKNGEDILILYGDVPFIKAETISKLIQAKKTCDIAILGFDTKHPGMYGRLISNGENIIRIVEAKDATQKELDISICNSGVILGKADLLFDLIAKIGSDNASKEFYLTDCIELAAKGGFKSSLVLCDEKETTGVNSLEELARAEELFQKAKRIEFMEQGVQLNSPETVFFSFDTKIGKGTVIEQNVVIAPAVTIEENATIRAFSHLEGCHIFSYSKIGPYARIRPGSIVSEGANVGNFVEVKKSIVGPKSKINHISYIGDAKIGEKVNVGAGSITCNYDGVSKHNTEIGDSAFIGSNTMLIAPVKVGKNSVTASGSVITKDVPDEALAFARSRQENKIGMAKKLMNLLRKQKNKS